MRKFTVFYGASRNPDWPLYGEVTYRRPLRCPGRSLREVQANLLAALAQATKSPITPEDLVEDFSRLLPARLRRQLEELREMEELVRRLPQKRIEVAEALLEEGLSTRDAGWLIGGVSYQRVHQLVRNARIDRRRPTTAKPRSQSVPKRRRPARG